MQKLTHLDTSTSSNCQPRWFFTQILGTVTLYRDAQDWNGLANYIHDDIALLPTTLPEDLLAQSDNWTAMLTFFRDQTIVQEEYECGVRRQRRQNSTHRRGKWENQSAANDFLSLSGGEVSSSRGVESTIR
jgi:hypothetical protein